jgi:hypothetical protein
MQLRPLHPRLLIIQGHRVRCHAVFEGRARIPGPTVRRQAGRRDQPYDSRSGAMIIYLQICLPGGKRSDIYSWDLVQSVPEPRSLGVCRRQAIGTLKLGFAGGRPASSSDFGSAPLFLFGRKEGARARGVYPCPLFLDRNPIWLCVPSQNGLLLEPPQRHNDITTVVAIGSPFSPLSATGPFTM